MNTLYRLVYTSFRKPVCTDTEIKNILAACKKNNPKRSVTGILLHSRSRFLQYIEGSKKDVEELYQLIHADPRHTSVNQRNFEAITARIFPTWEMGYFDLEDHQLQFDSDISTADKEAFEQIFETDIDYNDTGMKLLKLFNQSTLRSTTQ